MSGSIQQRSRRRAPPPGPTGAGPRRALAVAMLGLFVVVLDAQVVNLALIDIRGDLGGDLSGLQWVVTGYALAFSALLLFGGTLSDRIGARRTYAIGMALFVAASAACGLAPNLTVLVAARIAQGAGAALITPTSLALIRAAYGDPTRRARAIGYWAMGGAAAAAAGPILGGALTQLDWRLIFFINLPVGLLALALLFRFGTSPNRAVPFDWTGQISATLAMAALTYAIIEGAARSYADPPILGAFVVAAGSLCVFLTAQARGRHPMVPPALLRARSVQVSITVGFIGMVGFYGTVFLQSLYFQQVRGTSPLQTGLLFLPMALVVAILNPVAARLGIRFGRLVPIVGGQLVMAAGLVGLCLIPADAPTLVVAAVMIPVAVGGALPLPPITSLLIDHVPADLAGTGSGLLNVARQLGGSLGVAGFGAIVVRSADFMQGLRLSLLITAALLVITTAFSLTLRRNQLISTTEELG
jgi:DHA2 family methylenomycin A resistance protein-like MFS transporter